MNLSSRPIEIPTALAKLLQAQVLKELATGLRYTLPGNMVWHQWGDAKAPTVVFLHGGSGSWTHWIHNITPLVQDGYRVLAVDLPGFGDSDPPASGGDVDALIQPLHEAWQFLRGHESTSLVGFSFGGMTAALWMAAYPEDANHLVLVGVPGLGVNSPHRIPLKGWRHLPTLEMQEKAHEHNLLSLMLHEAKNLNDLAMAVHVGNVTRDRMTRRRLSTTTIVLDNLPHIACPVHVIYGEFDAMYQERMPEVEAVFKKAIPQLGSWQLIPDAGHWVQFESPERFQHALHLTLKAM